MKKVINQDTRPFVVENVYLHELREDKIYGLISPCNYFYFLARSGVNTWVWISLSSFGTYSSGLNGCHGSHISFKSAINAAFIDNRDIFEFYTFKDFYEWTK